MAQDCLLTAYKKTAVNSDLLGVGEVEFTFRNTVGLVNTTFNKSQYSAFVVTDTTKFELIGDAHFERNGSNLGKTVILQAYDANVQDNWMQVYVETADVDIILRISDVYKISTTISGNETTGFFSFSNISKVKNLESLRYADGIKTIYVKNLAVPFQLSDILLNKDIIAVNAPGSNNVNNVVGDIAILGDYIKLRKIDIPNAPTPTGTIESMVERFVENGLEDSTIEVRFNNNDNITLNGSGSFNNAGLFQIIKASGVVSIKRNDTIYATYTISTGVWEYTS